jgi:hypothetical protein
MWTDVSEERITSIFKVENQPGKKLACCRWIGRNVGHIRIARRCIPEDGNNHNYRCDILGTSIFGTAALENHETSMLTALCLPAHLSTCNSRVTEWIFIKFDELVLSSTRRCHIKILVKIGYQ